MLCFCSLLHSRDEAGDLSEAEAAAQLRVVALHEPWSAAPLPPRPQQLALPALGLGRLALPADSLPSLSSPHRQQQRHQEVEVVGHRRPRKKGALAAASISWAPLLGPIGILRQIRTRLQTVLGLARRRLVQLASTVAAALAPPAPTVVA